MSAGLIEVMLIGTSGDERLLERLADALIPFDIRARPTPLTGEWPVDAESLSVTDAVVVLWSRDAAESTWIKREVEEAREVRPVVVGVADFMELPSSMHGLRAIDISEWTERDDPAMLEPLVGMVRAMTQEPSEYEPISEWEREVIAPDEAPEPSGSATEDSPSPHSATDAPGARAATMHGLRPGTWELLALAEAVARLRNTPASALDLVLAALVRPTLSALDADELRSGATHALHSAIPEPRIRHLEAALAAAGAGPDALAAVSRAVDRGQQSRGPDRLPRPDHARRAGSALRCRCRTTWRGRLGISARGVLAPSQCPRPGHGSAATISCPRPGRRRR